MNTGNSDYTQGPFDSDDLLGNNRPYRTESKKKDEKKVPADNATPVRRRTEDLDDSL